jgi:hypothetical protein
MRSCVIAAMTLAAARAEAPAFKITDVSVNPSTLGGIIINYRTLTPTGDCNAQAVELPKVWDPVVETRLSDSSGWSSQGRAL